MGDRYEIELHCAYCKEKNEVWYAPTSGSDTFHCTACGKTNFVIPEYTFKTKKIEDTTLADVVEGFEFTTTLTRTEKEIRRICEEHLKKIRSR